MNDPVLVGFIVALGLGLLIGTERERRRLTQNAAAPAGIRTFALTSLLGAIAITVGGETMLAVAALGVSAMAAVAYVVASDDDKGLTTEIALTVTVLLGGLAMRKPEIAAGLGVVVTGLLISRTELHRFVGNVLTEDEVQHALMFAAATFIVLPVLPDRGMGPFGAINPRNVWLVAILVMAISAVGYVAVRVLGAGWGLPIAGLASGFVSSTATIGAMATRAAQTPEIMAGAVAGAVLSSLATVLQLAVVLFATSLATLQAMALPLLGAGIVTLAYSARYALGAMNAGPQVEGSAVQGEPFSLRAALMFAALLTAILLLAAALRAWLGPTGAIIAAAVGGFADVHAPAIAVASLVATGKLPAEEAALPILAAFTANTISKVIAARAGGNAAFAWRLIPGLVLIALGGWVGWAGARLLAG